VELTERVTSEASLSMPVLLDDRHDFSETYGLRATPTTLLVDPAGRIIFKHVGYAPGMELTLEREIDLLLERSPA
jgi:thioredoxin-related protein